MARRPGNNGSRIAAGGILAAASLMFLWGASLAPSGRIGLTAAAGLFPMAAVLAAGSTAGYLCWAASGILSFFIVPDKGISLLYLLFLGLYPVLKNNIEAHRKLLLEWVMKLACFNLALTVFWFLFRSLFLPHVPEWIGTNGMLIYALGNPAFILYDFGLSGVIAVLRSRLGSKSRRGTN